MEYPGELCPGAQVFFCLPLPGQGWHERLVELNDVREEGQDEAPGREVDGELGRLGADREPEDHAGAGDEDAEGVPVEQGAGEAAAAAAR